MSVSRALLLVLGFLVPLAIGVSSVARQLPQDYWQLPLKSQGEAPRMWTPQERSLSPESCGACHADKFDEWRTSLHAKAFSPGLVGQLITYSAKDAAACMHCHAPMAEQRQAFEAARRKGKAHLPSEQGLAAAGISCGGCHLRGHRRFGPPQRDTGAVGLSDTDRPHGGVMRVAEFETSGFCAACHQFPQSQAINGKPLENTLVEWQSSPAARESKSCQSCHMPDRKHLWRGIHDPDMVRSGLTPEFVATPDKARFRLTSTGVGHAFPTYVTPKVIMKAVALDAMNEPVVGSETSYLIRRHVEFVGGEWVELSDTRLLPGQSATLEVAWPESGTVQFWLEVHPDDFYHRSVYSDLLRQLAENNPSGGLIATADRIAQSSHFRLFETALRRP